MIISQKQINLLTEELQTHIQKREAAVKYAIKTFNSWKDIANHLKILLFSLTRAKAMILNDEKELNDIKIKCKDFSKLSQIDTNDPNEENRAIIFVEIQAIIGSNTQSATNGILEVVQDDMRRLKKILDSKGLSEEKNITERKNEVQQRIITTGRSVERVQDKGYIAKRKLSETNGTHQKRFEYRNQDLMNDMESNKKHQDFMRKTLEDKECLKYIENNMKLIEPERQSHRRNNDKEYKSNLQKERTWQYNHEKNEQPNNRGPKFTKDFWDQNLALIQPMPGAKLISRQNIDLQRGRMACVSSFNFNFNSKPVMEALNILAEENKTCSICNEKKNSATTLKCCGRICLQCLRKKVIEAEPRIFLNHFEAEKKQIVMCVCSTHKTMITIEQLLMTFTHKEIERMSIDALKREKKLKKSYMGDISKPNLCIDCKKIIEDDLNTIKVCTKHKICCACYE